MDIMFSKVVLVEILCYLASITLTGKLFCDKLFCEQIVIHSQDFLTGMVSRQNFICNMIWNQSEIVKTIIS